MKIEVNELGGGLTRLQVVADGCCGVANVPTAVADDIMRDVIRRRKNGDFGCGCHTTPIRTAIPTPTTPSWARPLPTPQREDGIDAHIDRPQRSNYGGNPFLAENAFRKDMTKYNTAVDAIKACNWPCKEDMKGVPAHMSQHDPLPRTQFVGVPNYRNMSCGTQPRPWLNGMPRPTQCGCGSDKEALRKAIGALAAIVEHMA